jgi:hypothetical protein
MIMPRRGKPQAGGAVPSLATLGISVSFMGKEVCAWLWKWWLYGALQGRGRFPAHEKPGSATGR